MKNYLYTLCFTFYLMCKTLIKNKIVLSSIIIVKRKMEKISVKHNTEKDAKSYIKIT